MKWIAIAVIAALAAGLAGGAYFMHMRLGPQLAEIVEERDGLRTRVERVQDALDAEAAERDTLSREKRALGEELARLVDELEERTANATLEVDFADEAPPPVEPVPEASPRNDRFEAMRRFWAENPPSEEQLARMSAAQARMEEEYNAFIDTALETTSDAVAQERIAALAEYPRYLRELQREMRSAESDEDRAALREEYLEARAEAREMIREQQNHMLRELGEAQGIDSTRDQDQFVRQLRETLRNPFFSRPEIFTGERSGRRPGGMGSGGMGPGGRGPMPRGGNARPQRAP